MQCTVLRDSLSEARREIARVARVIINVALKIILNKKIDYQKIFCY